MSDFASLYVQVVVPADDFDRVMEDFRSDSSRALAKLEAAVTELVTDPDGPVMVEPVRDAVILTVEGAKICQRALESLDEVPEDYMPMMPEDREVLEVIERALEVISDGG